MKNQIAEIEVSYSTTVDLSNAPQITSSRVAKEILSAAFNPNHMALRESFKVLFLNRANKVLGVFNAFEGGVSGVAADGKIIFGAAVKALASGLILCHNHPSGNTEPSREDIRLTKNLKEFGRLVEIEVIDHIILTPNGSYTSFLDEGLI